MQLTFQHLKSDAEFAPGVLRLSLAAPLVTFSGPKTSSSEHSRPWKASRLHSAVEPQWLPGRWVYPGTVVPAVDCGLMPSGL